MRVASFHLARKILFLFLFPSQIIIRYDIILRTGYPICYTYFKHLLKTLQCLNETRHGYHD